MRNSVSSSTGAQACLPHLDPTKNCANCDVFLRFSLWQRSHLENLGSTANRKSSPI